MEQFSVMAYTVFNAESWDEHDMIRKAAENRKYAELWLFVALHFVCALRKPDIARLPVPSLPYPPQETRRRIERGLFAAQEARSISEELLFRVDMLPVKPSKTGQHNVSSLKLFIPESVLEPLGIIMALSLSWRENGDPFVGTELRIRDIREFFGKEFDKAIGHKRSLSRRANKAYLQGIEAASDNHGCADAKGYMLAALARSHKGGIGKLPEMTDVYLQDANFSGYAPEFILREMFERGIFGFIPALLLEQYAGTAFLKLGVSKQTRLIKAIGLDALQLESLTASVMRSFRQSSEIVRSLMEQRGDKSALASTLQNIAAGSFPPVGVSLSSLSRRNPLLRAGAFRLSGMPLRNLHEIRHASHYKRVCSSEQGKSAGRRFPSNAAEKHSGARRPPCGCGNARKYSRLVSRR